MEIKGFENKIGTVETPNDSNIIEKPLKIKETKFARVDINVLKSKLREKENNTLKKNIFILIGCLAFILIAGVYVTY